MKQCEEQHGGFFFFFLYKQHLYGNCLLPIGKKGLPQQHSIGVFLWLCAPRR